MCASICTASTRLMWRAGALSQLEPLNPTACRNRLTMSSCLSDMSTQDMLHPGFSSLSSGHELAELISER